MLKLAILLDWMEVLKTEGEKNPHSGNYKQDAVFFSTSASNEILSIVKSTRTLYAQDWHEKQTSKTQLHVFSRNRMRKPPCSLLSLQHTACSRSLGVQTPATRQEGIFSTEQGDSVTRARGIFWFIRDKKLDWDKLCCQPEEWRGPGEAACSSHLSRAGPTLSMWFLTSVGLILLEVPSSPWAVYFSD